MEREIRGGIAAEIRATADSVSVSGYAAVFNQPTDIGGSFREVIAPGAFSEAIGRDDVVFLINHAGLPLARTSSGTLTLSEDEHGLMMETVLDADDPDVMTIVPKMKRGDLNKMSFAFRSDVEEWEDDGTTVTRTIKKVTLCDVSIVTSPAYDGTSIALRNLEASRKQKRQSNFSAAAQRLRMKMNLRLRGTENG